jgi:hypothetical protein
MYPDVIEASLGVLIDPGMIVCAQGEPTPLRGRCTILYPCPESDAAILARPFLNSRYARERIPDQDRKQNWKGMISAEWRAFAVWRVTINDCLNP